MAVAKCLGCGWQTNSATSNMWNTKDWKPTECYARWDEKNEGWCKGCSFDKASKFNQQFAEGLFKKKPKGE